MIERIILVCNSKFRPEPHDAHCLSLQVYQFLVSARVRALTWPRIGVHRTGRSGRVLNMADNRHESSIIGVPRAAAMLKTADATHLDVRVSILA
jgi:hypothetical protein